MLRVGLSLHILTFSPDILMLRGDGASHSAFFLWEDLLSDPERLESLELEA